VTPTRKALPGLAAAAIALSFAIGPSFAQSGGPIDPGVFTVDVVHPWRPFHSPSFDVESFDLAGLPALADGWDAMELYEVRARCSTIVTNTSRAGTTLAPAIPYTEAAVGFCEALFAWTAENRPDAPSTWDEAVAAE
jgi:hypothetical protein